MIPRSGRPKKRRLSRIASSVRRGRIKKYFMSLCCRRKRPFRWIILLVRRSRTEIGLRRGGTCSSYPRFLLPINISRASSGIFYRSSEGPGEIWVRPWSFISCLLPKSWNNAIPLKPAESPPLLDALDGGLDFVPSNTPPEYTSGDWIWKATGCERKLIYSFCHTGSRD